MVTTARLLSVPPLAQKLQDMEAAVAVELHEMPRAYHQYLAERVVVATAGQPWFIIKDEYLVSKQTSKH